MKGKTEIEKTIVALTLVVAIVLGIYFALSLFMISKKPIVQVFTTGAKPNAEKLNLTIPNSSDTEGMKAFAYNLYQIANENYKQTENVTMMVESNTQMFGGAVNVPVYRFITKNKDKLYYLEYSFIQETNSPGAALLSALTGAVSAKSTKFALRRYTDATMDKVLAQRVIEPTPRREINEETGEIIFDVDWTKYTEEEEKQEIYHAGQEGEYQQTEQIINVETIRQVEITYNEKEGYYTLVLDLDPDLATTITRPRLIAGSNDNTAHYTELKQTIEIWDNGYFRYFCALDSWSGKMVSSVIDFRTVFHYDSYRTNIANIQYMSDIVSAFGK